MSTTYNALAAAISQEENSSYLNNPGGLMDESGNPLTFSTYDEGLTALENKLSYDTSGQSSLYSPDMSLADFENVYTGGDPNAGSNVASIMGVSPNTPVSQLSDQSLGLNPYQLPDTLDPNLESPITGGATVSPQGITTSTVSGSQTTPASQVTWLNGIEQWLSSSSTNIVGVILGLILIAGAVWGFSQVKDTVIETGKSVARGAAEMAA